MSILTIVQDAMVLCNLTRPDGIVSSVDPTILQFVALAQIDGDELSTMIDWRRLKVPYAITGDGATEYWPLPSDWDRIVTVGEAFWSSKYPSIPLIGPLLDTEFLRLKALPVTPIRPVWRLMGNRIQIWPVLSNGEVVSTEYRSSNWITASDGTTAKPRFTSDSDLPVISERLLTLGLIWRWKASKGLDYAEDFRSYENMKTVISGHDSGNRIVHMSTSMTLGPNQWPGVISVVP
jgi:hypothetical protein